MPRPLTFYSQSDYLIRIVDINSHTKWQTVQIRSVGFFRSQLIWIYTVCKSRVYLGSAGQGLSSSLIWVCTRDLREEYLVMILGEYFFFLHKFGMLWALIMLGALYYKYFSIGMCVNLCIRAMQNRNLGPFGDVGRACLLQLCHSTYTTKIK